MKPQPTPEETALWQKRLASQANNRAWALADAPVRTSEEDEEMLQAAHAAMYFWKIVGNAGNHAHAALLLAHVHALLCLPGAAGHYLQKCEAHFLEGARAPWEQAYAHLIAANVAAAQGHADVHRQRHALACSAIDALTDPEDQAILRKTLQVVPVPQG